MVTYYSNVKTGHNQSCVSTIHSAVLNEKRNEISRNYFENKNIIEAVMCSSLMEMVHEQLITFTGLSNSFPLKHLAFLININKILFI